MIPNKLNLSFSLLIFDRFLNGHFPAQNIKLSLIKPNIFDSYSLQIDVIYFNSFVSQLISDYLIIQSFVLLILLVLDGLVYTILDEML